MICLQKNVVRLKPTSIADMTSHPYLPPHFPPPKKSKENSVYNVVSKSKFSTRCAKTRYKWSYKATIFFHSENQWSVKAPTYYNMGFLGPHLGPSQPPAPLRHCRRFTVRVAPSAVDLPDNAWHVAARPWEGWEV